ncbi:MAG: hypothetical protein H8K03_21665 [Nitrospira sp.]
MDIPSIDDLQQQWAMLSSSPYVSSFAIAVIGGLMFLIFHLIYGSRFKSLEERLKVMDDRMGVLQKEMARLVPSVVEDPTPRSALPESPIDMMFVDDASCSELVPERAQRGQDMVSRKRYWAIIHNASGHDVQSVRAEMGSFRMVNDSGEEAVYFTTERKRFPLCFRAEQEVMDLPPRLKTRLYLISYVIAPPPSFIRVEGGVPGDFKREFMSRSKKWKFAVTVTANACRPVSREFMAYVNEDGLHMQACD